jgi:hypothetical protein
MTIRILLAADEPLVRTGIALILRAGSDMEIVGYAADGEQAIERARTLAPDIVRGRWPAVFGRYRTSAWPSRSCSPRSSPPWPPQPSPPSPAAPNRSASQPSGPDRHGPAVAG